MLFLILLCVEFAKDIQLTSNQNTWRLMTLWGFINRTFIVWSSIGFLCVKVIEACSSNTDCTYTYTDEEDACFMAMMYPNNKNEGFCYGGSWPTSGDCKKKNSYKDGCLNHAGNADNNFCVTNFCSSDTNVCESRDEATGCVIVPTNDPTPKPTLKPTPKPTPLPTSKPTSPPTSKPTNHPTIVPTKAPTVFPSADPTSNPTNATVAPSTHDQKQFIDSPLPFYSAAILFAVCVVAIIVGCIVRRNRKAKRTPKHSELSLPLLKQSIAELLDEEKELAIPIKNAMVILLAIGEYDENPTDPDQGLENGLTNLDVDLDIRNLLKLFGPNHLNYTIYPQYDMVKIHWTEDEIVSLLKERAAYLEKHLKKFDGLIVVISGHGFAGNICTSDCKWIEKIAIHRTFSQNHPLLRDLPRVFMFDCCDGKWDYSKGITPPRKPRNDKPRDQGLATQDRKGSDQGKGYALLDVEEETKEPWTKDQKNPDHRLVEINAANRGFQSKLKRDEGSYMLSEFVQRTISNLNKGQHEFVYKVFDEIQQELAVNKRKQQITTVYNDRTRYIKLMPNRD
eukprot:376927_1